MNELRLFLMMSL